MTWNMADDAGSPVPAGAYTTLTSTVNNQTARSWTSSLIVGGVFGPVFRRYGDDPDSRGLAVWAGRHAVPIPRPRNSTS